MTNYRIMRFKVLIMYDSEYKGYVADVPELLGCMSQGKTVDETLHNVKDAVKGWLFVEKKRRKLKWHEPAEMFLGEVTI